MLKEEIRSWILENKRIPEKLLNQVNDIPESVLEKLQKYESHLENKCILLTGKDSIYKDLVAIYFLLGYANKNKKIIYCSHPNIEMDSSYAVAIMRIELIKNTFNITKTAEAISEIITNGKVFIIGCESIKSIESLFDGSFSNLIISNSIEFQIPEINNQRIVI